MVEEIANVPMMTLGAAARTLPDKPSPATLWRWARCGVRSRDGQRHCLRVSRQGSKMFVTAAALQEFFGSVSAADDVYFQARREQAEAAAKAMSPPPRSEARRAKAIAQAKANLAAQGA